MKIMIRMKETGKRGNFQVMKKFYKTGTLLMVPIFDNGEQRVEDGY